MMQEQFMLTDTNGDGFITFQEVLDLATTFTDSVDQEQLKQGFEQADLNGDDQISFEGTLPRIILP